jgi:hypothetical protein
LAHLFKLFTLFIVLQVKNYNTKLLNINEICVIFEAVFFIN